MTPLLECRRLSKRFGHAVALDGVDFTLLPGEVHGLVGTNGAGKSTLMKILAGALPDYEGEIALGGQVARLNSPQAARSRGIAMVFQELSGVGPLSVAENLFLGRQPITRFGRIDWRRMGREARAQLAELNINVDVTGRLDSFPLVIRQMVEIARGIHSGAKILILDEPTSALSPPETRRLFELVARLREGGVSVIFISHFIEDVLAICDRVTILKDGRLVATSNTKEASKHEVIHRMLGHGLEGLEIGYEQGRKLPARVHSPPSLEAKNLSRPGLFSSVSLSAAPGECVALYGFVGAGHQELAQTLAGAAKPTSGQIVVHGEEVTRRSTVEFIRRGVVLVAADRGKSLVLNTQVYKNISLAHLRRLGGNWLMSRRETAACQPFLNRVGCCPNDPWHRTGHLSGGNQQKVVFARWLGGPIRVLVLEEPTRGMDVRAKEEVMAIINGLKAEGAAVVLATTEPELALAHADRILVISRGGIQREFTNEEVDKATLLRHC
jgi:ribose transport system ATP-binding protein